MAEILNSLSKVPFPLCVRIALEKLTIFNTKDAFQFKNIPDLSEKIVQEYVFCIGNFKTLKSKTMTPIQELQVVETLLKYFHNDKFKEHSGFIFNQLFSSPLEVRKQLIFIKVVCMSVVFKNSPLLDLIALWMQYHGCSSSIVKTTWSEVVKDYCLLSKNTSFLLALPSVSKLMACNFLTTLTVIYNPLSETKDSDLLIDLLEIIVDWLENDCTLCLYQQNHSGLWTSPTKPNTQTPIPGLVRWCTQAPLIYHDRHQNKSILWSRLHLSILCCIKKFSSMPGANQRELITLADMRCIVRECADMIKNVSAKYSGQVKETLHLNLECSLDRVVQTLQVSIATGAFRSSLSDLQDICHIIPNGRLLDILQNQHLTRAPPQMHYEAS